MKILYDSSVLISALLKESAIHKTGIFRYVENLALGLQKKQGISLNFYSSLNSEQHKLWQQTLLNLAHLKKIPTVNIYHPFKAKLQTVSDQLSNTSSWKKVFLKGYRESLRLLLNRSQFEQQQFDDFDLFYSPYHPVPKPIRDKKNLISFTTIHDLIPIKFPKFFKVNKRDFFDRILKNPKPWNYYFALSESTKADMCHYYSIPPEKIFIVHSAPSSNLFFPVNDALILKSVQEKYHIKAPYLLSLATFEPRKNIYFLVESFIKLIEEQPHLELTLVLAGTKGWGFESLLDKIKKYPKRIKLTGFVADEDLAALYSGAMAFVYPSLYEGFGLPPLEAMNCGTPVIVSDRSSLPEVVGNAGLYIDPTSRDDLCERVLKIYGDSELRTELSEKSLIQAKKFSWENNTQAAHSAFQSIF
ncbi:MAG: D-inositol-3-phosphate glycosyltransferase [Chlamydiae bacterium]|nr:D-inositol-3-phosphate glycosyltransferase [Chlamydiota bacterium]